VGLLISCYWGIVIVFKLFGVLFLYRPSLYGHMLTFQNLTVIGTSHIAKDSVKKVREVILDKRPTVVALELDAPRLKALLSGVQGKPSIRDIRRFGIKGWLFGLVGHWIEQKLGSKVGVSPGSEMLAGFRAAGEVHAKIALIDQDITITLRRFTLTFREIWHFFVDLFRPRSFEISGVPDADVVCELMDEVKVRYPSIYRVLIEERNNFMAKRLARLMKSQEHIVAVVGLGHERELVALVKKYLNKFDFVS